MHLYWISTKRGKPHVQAKCSLGQRELFVYVYIFYQFVKSLLFVGIILYIVC